MVRAAALAAALLLAAPARADDSVWLARVAVAESGWSSTADQVAIWHTLRRRAAKLGISLPTMVVSYSSPLRRGHWALGLEAHGRRPPGFPARLSWGAHRPRWEAILEHARAFLHAAAPDPCPEAEHFGDRDGDLRRALRKKWTPVDCGPTANLFWTTRKKN